RTAAAAAAPVRRARSPLPARRPAAARPAADRTTQSAESSDRPLLRGGLSLCQHTPPLQCAMAMFLFKTEPSEYSFDDLLEAGTAVWDGVRNAQALLHLRTARKGDEVLIYETGNRKAIVGLAQTA